MFVRGKGISHCGFRYCIPVRCRERCAEMPDENSTNLLVELRSILEPLQLASLFSKTQPLEVELGSGDGSFLVAYAQSHPEQNCLGVERLLGRIRKTDRKGRRAGLTNLRAVRIESSYFLEYLLPIK